MKKQTLITLIIILILAGLGWWLWQSQATTSTTAQITPTATSTTNLYSLSEVATHNQATDCWLAIDGKVYDVTNFIASGQHNPQIIQGCGKDASTMFHQVDKHQGATAQSLLPQMQIGVLATS